jgi:hypothetical protein
MSITRLTDAEVREGTMELKDDERELWKLAIEVTKRSPHVAGLYNIDGGKRVLVTNLSGKVVIDADVKLPQDSDDEFTQSGKRKFIRIVMTQMRKLIRDEPGNAA